jgi:hypothetical protein
MKRFVRRCAGLGRRSRSSARVVRQVDSRALWVVDGRLTLLASGIASRVELEAMSLIVGDSIAAW